VNISPVLKEIIASFHSFHAYNIGHLASRASQPLFTPCTPTAVLRLLETTGVPLEGAHAVVLGRSDIVGSPVAAMLRNRDATVTQCHSYTKDLPDIVIIRLCLAPSTLLNTIFSLLPSSNLLILWLLQWSRRSLCAVHG
jgi:hypothetical protein